MYLGIDIGTSSVKAVLIDDDQRIVASRSEPLDVERPHPTWSEQDPESWVAATSSAIDALCRDHPKRAGARARHRPFRPDARRDADRQGRPAAPPLHPVERRPLGEGGGGARRRSALPRDHRQHRLSGLHRAEARLGAPPRAEDFRRGRQGASAEGLCAALADRRPRLRHVGFRRHVLARRGEARLVGRPPRRDASSPRPDAEALRGHRADREAPLRARHALGHGAPPVVAGGAGDNAASACGVGTVAPGAAFVSLGTSGVLFVSNEKFRPNAASAVHAFCHALPNTWHQMGVILSAAASLEWLGEVTGASAGELAQSVEDQAAGRRAALLPPLPLRRAHAAQRHRGARQLRRPLASDRSRGDGARRAGGRRLRLRRLPGGAEGRRHEGRARHRGRRRLALACLAEDHRQRR